MREIWQLLDSRGMGGIETHVFNLSITLNNYGCRARVVFLNDYGQHPLREKCTAAGIATSTLSGSGELWAVLKKENPALLHTHGYKAGIVGRLAARFCGIPSVSTYHAGDRGEGRVRLYTWMDEWTAFLGRPLSVNEDIAGRINGKCEVLPNFVPVPKRRSWADSSIVAFVGRFSDEKGDDHFCELAMRRPEIDFDAFGGGPNLIARRSVFGNRVLFHGAVADMSLQWRNIGLLCMPSRIEGLPLAALEAMSHGVPVAAFGVGALPRIIDHANNGWVVPPGDIDALEQSIVFHFKQSHADRDRMSRRARNTIAERFSADQVVCQILDFYGRTTPTTRLMMPA